MQEFYYEDVDIDTAITGIVPQNDVNCKPYDYFRIGHAINASRVFCEIIRVQCPIRISENLIEKFILKKTDEQLEAQLKNSKPNIAIHSLLTNEFLTKKEQQKLMKGLVLNANDILWLNKEAQDMGYLVDIYHIETYPPKFNEKKLPAFFLQKEDGTINTIGETDMTDGEMRALLEQRKVVQARIYHKNSTWHCFYFTFKGLAGLESGSTGSKPHYHYLSDKSCIAWDDLINRIKGCDMPASKIHIIIDRQFAI